MLKYGIAIFFSAFMLFQVQPQIGRLILPWFGGTPGVWTTCMLFFQSLLVAGYGYAFFLQNQPVKSQARIHLMTLAISVGFLFLGTFVVSDDFLKPDYQASNDPTIAILFALLVKIGVPYFTMASN